MTTTDQHPPPLHESLPPMGISARKNELMGFRLGTSFESQRQAFEALSRQGFESPPPWAIKPLHRFMLEKREGEASTALEPSLTFEYEEDKLTRVGFVIARESVDGEDPEEIIEELKSGLEEALGSPHLVLARTAEWLKQGVHTQDPALAFAMFWSGSKNVPPQATTTSDSSAFFDALVALGHDGALGTITGILGNYIAAVDFFQGKTNSQINGSFLSFMKKN